MLVFCVVATSCKETDDRDQFVGTYSMSITGSMTATVEDQPLTVPLNDTGQFTITKSAADDFTVNLSGGIQTTATVTGNSIKLDPESGTSTSNGIIFNFTITYDRGTLAGGNLSFTASISGQGYYQGYSFPLFGSLSIIANKL